MYETDTLRLMPSLHKNFAVCQVINFDLSDIFVRLNNGIDVIVSLKSILGEWRLSTNTTLGASEST